jgi:NAD(P)-dependent dehydrogenase (short-subunit alcohol dehydrogenase family)
MSQRLKERVTLITGGTGQLGRHVVARALAEGARVHVPVFDPDEGELLRSHLDHGEGLPEGASARLTLHDDGDLTDPDRVEAIFQAAEEREGRGVEILFNLAGGFEMAPVEETDPGSWERLWQMNATTAFLCSRAAFPGMKEGGWGRIVNVSALPAVERGQAGLSAYGAAKAAVLNLTQSLSREGVGKGITVNAVLPSIIDTAENREAMPDADTSTWIPPEEVAGVLAFLASDQARVVNGAALTLTLG